jgi:zinc/manganese transport system substrate-binding protein
VLVTPAAPCRTRLGLGLSAIVVAAAVTAGGSLAAGAAEGEPGSVVVTTEVLGSIVGQLVGDAGEVTVIMPSGANPHSYEPSARDAERILGADVVVSNGLELEEALLSVLEAAEADGATWFEAADHITVRELGETGGLEDHDAGEHEHHLEDPHIWTDPVAMEAVVAALEPVLTQAGFDIDDQAAALVNSLESLDAEVTQILAVVPTEQRKLVTGHRSLGYFADRYGFEQIGTVIPSLSTSGEPTARELAALIEAIREHDVTAVFTEVGTPESVARAVADDSGARLVELSTSQLPEGGRYQDLVRDIASTIADALAP